MSKVNERRSDDASAINRTSQPPLNTELITSWKWSSDDDHVRWPRKKRLSGKEVKTKALPMKSIEHANLKLPVTDLHAVKPSALLYEITERTKELAKPRSIKTEYRYDEQCENDDSRKSIKRHKFPKLSERVLKLSCPKVVVEASTRTVPCGVSPGALKAVATQRILELSVPKKQQTQPLPMKKRKSYLMPCSPRTVTLARPKRSSNLFSGNSLNNSRRRPKSFPSHFRRNVLGKNFRDQAEHSRSFKESSRMNRTAEKNNGVKNSSSNRSVIVIGKIYNPKKFKPR